MGRIEGRQVLFVEIPRGKGKERAEGACRKGSAAEVAHPLIISFQDVRKITYLGISFLEDRKKMVVFKIM